MRKWMILPILLITLGCNTSSDPVEPAEVTVNTPEMPNGGPFGQEAVFSIVEKPAMSLVQWSGTVSNPSTVFSSRLIIDCVDENGQIVAEDHMPLVLQPQASTKCKGEIDVPTEVISRIKKVHISLVVDKPLG